MKNKIKEFLAGKNAMRVIVSMALIGILLLACVDFPVKEKEETKQKVEEDYCLYVEEKLKEIVIAITGETSPQIMVSLNTKQSYVYATNEDSYKDQDKEEKDQEYIIIENSEGDEQGMLLTQLEPEIKGVVVVSEFANNSLYKESITNAVQTALGLSSTKVCVVNKNK